MPNNAILMIGLGLAAFTLFRREESDVGETELVNASMLSSGTGTTGKALGNITTIKSDLPIGGDPLVIPVSDTDVELPNFPIGPEPKIPAVEEVQSPVFIATPVVTLTVEGRKGEQITQIGLTMPQETDPDAVDMSETPIFVEVFTPTGNGLTMDDPVQVLSGGANLGGSYFTDLDTLVIAREQGYFDIPTWDPTIGPNVFDAGAAANVLIAMTEPIEVTPDPWMIQQEVDVDIGI